MKITALIIFLLSLVLPGFCQYSTGLVTGNYAGSMNTLINPALMANSRLKTDINLFAAHGFLENNYFYLPPNEAGFFRIMRGIYEFPYFQKPYGKGDRNVYSYYDDKSLKNIFVKSRIVGPSTMFSFHDHVFAVTTGARMMSSTRRLPYDIANFAYYTMDFKPQQNIYYERENYDMASMAWFELNLSYATVFARNHYNHWSAGFSIGPRFGYSGAYLEGGDTRYIAYNDSILNVELLDAELGIALPFDYNDHDARFRGPVIRGAGLGVDFGISWQFRERPYQKKFPGNFYIKRFEDYRLKVGLSLMDVGYIRFNKNAEKHVYDHVHNNWIRTNQLEYVNLRYELNTASEIFYGDSTASLRDYEIRIYLPTSVNIQVDYHVTDWWYVSTMVVFPAKLYSPMIEVPFTIAVSPRYESSNLEVNIPLVLYDLKYPKIGISVRIAGLTIGSDDLAGLFGITDFTGADAYIAYKINIGNNGKNPFASKGACFNDWRLEMQKIRK